MGVKSRDSGGETLRLSECSATICSRVSTNDVCGLWHLGWAACSHHVFNLLHITLGRWSPISWAIALLAARKLEPGPVQSLSYMLLVLQLGADGHGDLWNLVTRPWASMLGWSQDWGQHKSREDCLHWGLLPRSLSYCRLSQCSGSPRANEFCKSLSWPYQSHLLNTWIKIVLINEQIWPDPKPLGLISRASHDAVTIGVSHHLWTTTLSSSTSHIPESLWCTPVLEVRYPQGTA